MKKKRMYLIVAFLVVIVVAGVLSQNDGKDVTAFINVNLVPMTGELVLEDQIVLVRDDLIIAIGNSEEVQIPRNATVIEGEGQFLLPGLADMHMHTRKDWDDQSVWPVHPLDLYLANGVTTIRDFGPYGSPLTYAIHWRDEISEGMRAGPMIYTSGKILFESPLGDAEKEVKRNYEAGFDFLKIYSYVSVEDFSSAVEKARELNFYSSGHIPYAVGLDGILGEMDEIAHIEELMTALFEYDRDQSLSAQEWLQYFIRSAVEQIDLSDPAVATDFIRKNFSLGGRVGKDIAAYDTPVCTTLVIDHVIWQKVFDPAAFLNRPENIFLEAGYLDAFLDGNEKHLNQFSGLENLADFKRSVDLWLLSMLAENDVLLILGTDAGTGGMGIIPGFSVHDELQILVDNGFTPYEAIRTATVNAAIVVERMNRNGNFGTIEVGQRADLILVKDNPLEEISTLRTPLGVMAAGRWYSAESLMDMLTVGMEEDSEVD